MTFDERRDQIVKALLHSLGDVLEQTGDLDPLTVIAACADFTNRVATMIANRDLKGVEV